jgi:hypothetical protein
MSDHRRKVLYRVKVTRLKMAQEQWEWEILRDEKPLAARLREGPFKSERTAMAAGAVALREFLDLLKIEHGDDG